MITQMPYGVTADGRAVTRYLLQNESGMQVQVLDYGCRIVSIFVPDRAGKPVDVVLGCKDLAAYEADDTFFGAFVGRFANRIEDARFTLDGVTYQLEVNNGPNHNHGVWHQKVFDAAADGENALVLRYHSPAGEDGFPGAVDVTVRYELTDQNALVMDYTATSDAATPINLTNHSYFNLDGPGSDSVLDHTLLLHASRYTPANEVSCPYGTEVTVKGTPMDFTTAHAIGRDIDEPFDQLQWGRGYDHNYVIDRKGQGLALAARLKSEKTGICMECRTTQPGVQLYTANWVKDKGDQKPGFVHGPRAAVCLETQHYPCGPNRPSFPSTILRPGDVLRETTVYIFSTDAN